MRKSLSVSLFSIAATMLVLGIAVMGISEMILVSRYFAQDKYETLDQVLDVADHYIKKQQADPVPLADRRNELDAPLTLIGETADAGLFLLGTDGTVLLSSAESPAPGTVLPPEFLVKLPQSEGRRYHTTGVLGGFLPERCYVSAGALADAEGTVYAYLVLCASTKGFRGFIGEMFSNFMLSACLMLLCASVLTVGLTRRIAEPLHQISEAAERFGGGDLSTRVEVQGDDEMAQLARNFNVMAANLEAIDHSRAEFMGNIAHELRTPMTTIKGFIDGILDGAIPPELEHHYLAIVSDETGRLARLVQNMLDISKLEAGEYQVHARLYNVWETLISTTLNAEQRITAGGIEIEGLEEDNKALVYADPDLIHQVVQNLLDNAIKFTPAGGVIRFSAVRLGPEVEISIWNSGAGISPEALPFVFERFYKEDASRGLNAKGAGLGLHICKVLVNLSGGQIRAESQQGEWCRFVFTLPGELPDRDNLLQITPDTEETLAEKARAKKQK